MFFAHGGREAQLILFSLARKSFPLSPLMQMCLAVCLILDLFACLSMTSYVFKMILHLGHEALYRVLVDVIMSSSKSKKLSVASMGFFFLMSSLSRKFNISKMFQGFILL